MNYNDDVKAVRRQNPIQTFFGLLIALLVLHGICAKVQAAVDKPAKPELVIQTSHSGGGFVRDAKFSPDGRLLATADGQEIILWHAESGRKLRTYKYPELKFVTSFQFSPNGKWMAGVGQKIREQVDGGRTIVGYSVIKVWDLEAGREVSSIRFDNEGIHGLAFSPDSKLLAGANDTRWRFYLWNVETGSLINTFRGHKKRVMALSFTPAGDKIVSGSEDGTVRVWEIETARETLWIPTIFATSLASAPFYSLSLAVSSDGKRIAAGCNRESTVFVWDAETGKIVKTFDLQSDSTSMAFSSGGKRLVTGQVAWGTTREIKVWDVESGAMLTSFLGHRWASQELTPTVSITPDGKKVVSSAEDDTIVLWDVESSKRERTIYTFPAPGNLTSSLDGKVLAFTTGHYSAVSFDQSKNSYFFDKIRDPSIKVLDIETGELSFVGAGETLREDTRISPDGKNLAGVAKKGTIEIFDRANGKVSHSIGAASKDRRMSDLSIISFWFSPDSKTLAALTRENFQEGYKPRRAEYSVKLWDVTKGDGMSVLVGQDREIFSIAFSADGNTLASLEPSSIKIRNISSGELVSSLPDTEANRKDVAVSFPELFREKLDANSRLDVEIRNARIILREKTTKREIVSLVVLKDNSWITASPDGRFDTNRSLEANQDLHWVMPDAPFTPVSLEIFMRDYYEPNLLPRLLKCTEEKNCDKEFKSVRDLTSLNRTQPKVSIVDVKPTKDGDVVAVTVEAADVVSEFQKGKDGNALRSGVEDLRLFRDGQLVGYEPETDGSVTLGKDGTFRKTFSVRLANDASNTEVKFTAHAFNSDRVKSETAQKTYTLPKALRTVKGTAYVVTIGVNANESRRYDLNYAANDSRRIQQEITTRISKDLFKRVIPIQLISAYGANGDLKENNATKAKIKAVLDKLAGRVSAGSLSGVVNADLLKKVRPDDLVLIAFSGHGYADRAGIFYMLPYDMGANTLGLTTETLGKAISSDELSLWLRDIDAGETIMIVDACHSAAAVQGKDFKPGPMGSRGLGQLSYDKGMKILTATRAGNFAFEVSQLAQGILSYVLVQDAVIDGKADTDAPVGDLTATEWLGYTVKRVPELFADIRDGHRGFLLDGKVVAAGSKAADEFVSSDTSKSTVNLQQPVLFDFRRRPTDKAFLNVTRTGH